ncbi:hypothetical protein HNQ91_001530 [Filimonas zeae]|uniref:Uncharacterized protein n=1 Tax=Filimonas zeae TaxID=1737353 RepID=A0A917IYN6_9BACT|nr:hypothetical protein [Filimonas zeae]MDR6338479.1 hypothetical protein [Filimonas zeae]GGH68068.1 hypothetical protein GCM10011379_23990 [Filimonas zeae]
MCTSQSAIGQQQDSIPHPPHEDARPKKRNSIFRKAGELILNAVTRSAGTDTNQVVLNVKVEDPYMPYKDKIIRKIHIKQLGFENPINDTTHRISYFGTRLLNSTHRTTRNWVIRNNLFIKENTPVSTLKMADNERFLRSLNFIQDARIIIKPIENEEDSVDVEVITKDVFTIQFELSDFSPDRIRGKIGDANAFGLGQLMQVRWLYETKRDPTSGYEFLYSKSNIANTFINATLAYSRINGSLRDGHQNDAGWRITLDRPLYSQYAHIAGSLSIGNNQTHNYYNQPDSQFYNYRYSVVDGWIGYNLRTGTTEYDRQFISGRYMNMPFSRMPYQVGDKYNERFNSKQLILGSYTFFRQNFYKTNYLYGFGITEDVPYGYNISLTGGWYKQNSLGRAYVGADANRYIITPNGNIIQYFMRTGGFFQRGIWEDANVLVGASMFSKLMLVGGTKVRQYLRFSATRQINRVTFDPLRIDNAFGIRYFSSDSVVGNKRISLHSETYLFLKYKLFGFKFAPFVFGDAALLTPETKAMKKSDLYYFIGGGVRTRNENFVFGTIELRAVYYPKTLPYTSQFKIMLNTDINFRFNSNYIKAPGLIQLNNDDNNSIY